MTSDEKTLLPSLLNYINSDLFTIKNISSSITLVKSNKNTLDDIVKWDAILEYLPLKFYKIIDSIDGISNIEEFDKKYIRNPKMCAYERYGTTNMWRPLMILNRCPTIMDFNFKFIRYYDIEKFTNILSVLISRVQSE
jgi:hypothetical protein